VPPASLEANRRVARFPAMTDDAPASPASPQAPPNAPQHARLDLQAGPVSLAMEVRVTPGGLLAIGGLVSGILLSTAVLVWSATAAPRRHPLAWNLGRRVG
jgi:hypothetical protein